MLIFNPVTSSTLVSPSSRDNNHETLGSTYTKHIVAPLLAGKKNEEIK